MGHVETTVIHKTVKAGEREYPMTITKQAGLQEIMVRGEPAAVENVTIFDSPIGAPRCYTRARPDVTPEDREAARRRLQEAATKAMIDLGIW